LIEEFMKMVKTFTKFEVKFSTSGGTSDARFIKDSFPVVELGLHSKMAHKINEYVEISDLQRLHNVYYYTLSEFLGP
jgi:succinyl-diaminopimelate desuccinylase